MAYLNSKPRNPKVCPVCGEEVPPRALACPECGSDHQTGWKTDAYLSDGLGFPDGDEDFDYEQFIQNEFGSSHGRRRSLRPRGLHPGWWITGIVLLLLWGVSLVFR